MGEFAASYLARIGLRQRVEEENPDAAPPPTIETLIVALEAALEVEFPEFTAHVSAERLDK